MAKLKTVDKTRKTAPILLAGRRVFIRETPTNEVDDRWLLKVNYRGRLILTPDRFARRPVETEDASPPAALTVFSGRETAANALGLGLRAFSNSSSSRTPRLTDREISDSSLRKARKYELLDPDVRLMLQVRDGSAGAFEALVAKHQNKLVGVLSHLVSNRSLAEDLAQDVFLRVYRARERYVPTAKFSTWLYTITHNVASNALRKASRRKEVNLKSSPSGSMPVRPLDTMAKAKSSLMPAREIARDEIATIVREAIQQLGDRQRMAMLLSRFEGMSYQEIADTMELSTQAVKSLLSRARSNLRDILEPYVESGQLPDGLKMDASDHDAQMKQIQSREDNE